MTAPSNTGGMSLDTTTLTRFCAGDAINTESIQQYEMHEFNKCLNDLGGLQGRIESGKSLKQTVQT